MTKNFNDADIAEARAQWNKDNRFEKDNFIDVSGQLQRERQQAFLSGSGRWVIAEANATLPDAFQILKTKYRSPGLAPLDHPLPQKEAAPKGWLGFFGGQKRPPDQGPASEHTQTSIKKR